MNFPHVYILAHSDYFKNTYTSYRPRTIVTVTLLAEHMLWLRWEDSAFKAICLSINAGYFGGGRSIISLLSIEITIGTVGLSVTNSCTHNRPTCMHLKISISKPDSDIIGSINSTMLSAFHNFHAWKPQNKIEIRSINIKTYQKLALEVFKNKAMK